MPEQVWISEFCSESDTKRLLNKRNLFIYHICIYLGLLQLSSFLEFTGENFVTYRFSIPFDFSKL